MNLLLQKLRQAGVMKHACVAFSDPRLIDSFHKHFPDRTVMAMGKEARPGPYWAVHAEDVSALKVAGYKQIK